MADRPKQPIIIEDNPRKRIERIIPVPGKKEEFIEFAKLDISNPEQLDKLMPANFSGTVDEWRYFAAFHGPDKAAGKSYMQYRNDTVQTRMKKGLITEENNNPVKDLGAIGKKAMAEANGDFAKFTEIITQDGYITDLTQLGLFSKWFAEAKLDPNRFVPILREYLND